MSKSFSQACENNKQPILEQLQHWFSGASALLEIGSGTGQHAIHFAPELPHLQWHTSDLIQNHASIRAWMAERSSHNLHPPKPFQIGVNEWPLAPVDAVFTANTTHIMQPNEAQLMMQLVAKHLIEGGVFCQYGPFKVNGACTTSSNAEFDASLKQRGLGGIRDIDELKAWGEPLQLVERVEMPANNFLLVWKKLS